MAIYSTCYKLIVEWIAWDACYVPYLFEEHVALYRSLMAFFYGIYFLHAS